MNIHNSVIAVLVAVSLFLGYALQQADNRLKSATAETVAAQKKTDDALAKIAAVRRIVDAQ